MIDDNSKVWLIEINTGPYLGTPNSWAEKVVPAMLDELFEITIDPVFNKNYEETEMDQEER